MHNWHTLGCWVGLDLRAELILLHSSLHASPEGWDVGEVGANYKAGGDIHKAPLHG